MTDAALPFQIPAALDQFAGDLETNWQRFCEAAEEEIIGLAAEHNELPLVWACSEFVANWCIRQPQDFAALLKGGDLAANYPITWYRQELGRRLAHCDDVEALDQTLRRFRQQQMVRLAWRDLNGDAQLEETMAAVSALADASIDAAVAFHTSWLRQRFGVPRDDNSEAVGLVVLGLGKLGGCELNYSSDVDLIFSYEGGGQTDGDRGISNQEFFIKLGRKIIHSLDRVDADGFVFRTDLRLRPNGDSGPLVLSFAAMEHYYQTHGRDWERYAWIKARVVAGDRSSGQNLLAMLRPFVYRKYLDFSAFDALREMKALIERQLQSKGIVGDIKLGQGGIREVEFLAQSHQLIRGGRETRLQTPSLYAALDEMVARGVLEPIDQKALVSAYRFLRNVEHRLQMVADRQTQKLPDRPLEENRLALSMGFASWEAFTEQLNRHRDEVHRQFNQLLTPLEGQAKKPADDNALSALRGLWLGELEQDDAEQVLHEAGFSKDTSLPTLLSQFRQGSLYQAFSSVERDRLDRLMPLVLRRAAKHEDANRAISAFISVVESIGRRSVYLSLLIENPIALGQLLHLCAASPWIARHIGQHPVVLDELLQPIAESVDAVIHCSPQAIRVALNQRLGQLEPDDDEARLNALREFHHGQVLRIAAADVGGRLEVRQVQRALTGLATVIVEQVLADAIGKVSQKQGPPPGEAAIIAYGKLAGEELGYHSDLDIVVCFSPDPNAAHSNVEYYFSRVGQRFIHLLTTRTHAGILFDLDMRLRPSGRSGTLVVSLKAFDAYQENNAWTWEHQALVRARVIVGSVEMIDDFERIRQRILCQKRDNQALRTAIISMRKRMVDNNCQSTDRLFDIKLDYGGIVDIEFLLQYLVLANAHDRLQDSAAITAPRDTVNLIAALVDAELLSPPQGDSLTACYLQYLRYSLDYKLMDRPVLIPIDQVLESRECVIRLWQTVFSNG